jgi:hypothetical protein
MLAPTAKTSLIIVAFVAVCGLAAAGWLRKIDRSSENAAVSTQAAPYQLPGVVESAPYDPLAPVPQPRYKSPVFSSADGYYPTLPRPAVVRQEPVAERPEITPERPDANARYEKKPIPRREYYVDSRGRRHTRSKAHSAEIVAGTAAAGAAIGAIAGGGKGAAIGAISGGGAGFAYDRLTHNK